MHRPFFARRALALIPATAALLAAIPASASAAAGLNCSASAARVTILNANTVEPTTANVGGSTCRTVSDTLDDATNGLNPVKALVKPVSAGAVLAYTKYDDGNGDPTKQTALAAGGVGELAVNALPTIPGLSIDQITAPLSATVNGASVPVNAIPVNLAQLPAFSSLLPAAQSSVLSLLGLPASTFTVDASQLVSGLVPAARALTATPLVGVKAAMAYAAASCKAGKPVVAGAPQLAGLTIAGQEVPTDQVVTRAVQLLPALSVDFSKVSATALSQLQGVPSGLSSAAALLGGSNVLPDFILNTVNGVLAKLPTVSVPALGASVTLTPGTAQTSDTQVTQRALTIAATVAGIRLADVVLGEATASAQNLDCSPAAAVLSPSTPTGATLQCSTRDLVLVDVLERADRVDLTGVADPKYIGKRVSILFEGTGHVVARPRVRKDGSFAATAPLPRRGLLGSNRARYLAKVGREKSLNLKLRRRLIVTKMVSRNGKVTIAGRVVEPLARPVAPITLRQRVSCSKDKVVKRFTPRRDGTFSITVAQPKKGGTAVYRLITRVRNSAGGRSTFQTFTLPRAVELHR